MKTYPTLFLPRRSSDSLLIWVIETGLRKETKEAQREKRHNCIIVSPIIGGVHREIRTHSEPCRFPAADVRAWLLETIWPTYPRLSALALYKGENLRNSISISADHPVLQEALGGGIAFRPDVAPVWETLESAEWMPCRCHFFLHLPPFPGLRGGRGLGVWTLLTLSCRPGRREPADHKRRCSQKGPLNNQCNARYRLRWW